MLEFILVLGSGCLRSWVLFAHSEILYHSSDETLLLTDIGRE